MMDQASIVQSIVFNNDGVDEMEHGLYDNAIISFTHALEILRPFVHATNAEGNMVYENDVKQIDSRGSQHGRRCSTTTSTQTNPTADSDESSKIEVDECDTTCCNDDDSTFTVDKDFVFRDPIEIPIRFIAKRAPSRKFFVKLTIVVMYNLALAFHLSALQTLSHDRLIRAKKLYEYAFQMHLQESCDVTLLYSLALMNNLGLIYRLLRDQDRSNECFQNMLATMMFLLEADEARTIKQWDGLLSNVMGCIFSEQGDVAAAA
jgi:hypothetical protein